MSDQAVPLNQLFISQVRIDILSHFIFNPNKPIHMRELARLLDQELNAIRRELLRLTEISALIPHKNGNKINYLLNQKFSLLPELKAMMFKAFKLGNSIITNASILGKINAISLLKPYIDGQKSDPNNLDLVIIGDVDKSKVIELIQAVEKTEGKEINYTILTLNEFSMRIKRSDRFVWKIITTPKINLIGDLILEVHNIVNA